jgi:hypothetical protein
MGVAAEDRLLEIGNAAESRIVELTGFDHTFAIRVKRNSGEDLL